MNERIQQKIDQIMQLAKNSPASADLKIPDSSRLRDDSLLKAIRNKQEADVFLAELETAIKMAKNR